MASLPKLGQELGRPLGAAVCKIQVLHRVVSISIKSLRSYFNKVKSTVLCICPLEVGCLNDICKSSIASFIYFFCFTCGVVTAANVFLECGDSEDTF